MRLLSSENKNSQSAWDERFGREHLNAPLKDDDYRDVMVDIYEKCYLKGAGNMIRLKEPSLVGSNRLEIQGVIVSVKGKIPWKDMLLQTGDWIF